MKDTILHKKDIEIIIVDDDEDIRINTSDLLSTLFDKISLHSSPETVLKNLKTNSPVVILTDLRMPDADGLEFANQVRNIDSAIPVILMTGYGDISTAVDAMKQGVYDFIEKPFDTDHLIATIKRAVDKRLLTLTLEQTLTKLSNHSNIESKIIGQCPPMINLRQQIINLAPMDIPILIFGETGTGKELVARCLHDYSKRKEGPFVALNCAAIPEQLAEAELFGHEKGAFTDASIARKGKLEYAKNGTLFLDEVESLPLSTQAKLLRALSDNIVTPLGSHDEVAINCRIISATKEELRENDEFRQDLFYRLQVAELKIPALRHRSEDIITLFEFFVRQQCENFETHYKMVNSNTRMTLLDYPWAGNVRELINVATRFSIQNCKNIELALNDNTSTNLQNLDNESFKEIMQNYEEKLLRAKLTEHQGRVSKVLEDLQMERRSFNQKLLKYGIITKEFK
ncbi:MAG: two-component system C4-dicarboxylate transport response regulator DctD [Cocleimonas sp.]|jgi:two-component system C4-dicarboxylate transport response regulator DctD